MPSMSLPEPEDDHDKAIFQHIREMGWSVLLIEDDPETNDNEPEFAYSVGLHFTHRLPEILLIGLPGEIAGPIINQVAAALVDGFRPTPGQAYADFATVPLAFLPVGKKHFSHWMGSGWWFYRGQDFPVLQCIWPLKNGLFPWDDGYDPAALEHQPLLWEPPDEE